ncbi:hypothetical protein T4E_2772 [Trichinella pseudospiralis]|uniref:Uncharacterized protein n=1 Tax=Trichinella pseudospiralis TaxID=6337 RepID=A0A0V0YFA1_TRIPS|nr:hypothetical protein T4E_2772 [Trichinella pseudospiralis]
MEAVCHHSVERDSRSDSPRSMATLFRAVDDIVRVREREKLHCCNNCVAKIQKERGLTTRSEHSLVLLDPTGAVGWISSIW